MSIVLEHLELRDFHAEHAILTGNPKRVEMLAEQFHGAEFVSDRRGFTTVHARLAPDSDRSVFIVGSGIGCPSVAIVAEELMMAGVHTLLRLGTCGRLQPELGVGDVVASTGVVRDDGTSRAYVRDNFPAVPSHELLFALNDVRADFDWPLHIGLTHVKDTFYTQKPDFSLDREANRKHWQFLRDAGVLVTEMEASVLYILAQLRRTRSLALLVTASMDRKNPHTAEGLRRASDLARRVLLAAPPMPEGWQPPQRNIHESILDELT